MNVLRDKVVAMCEALGFKGAGKWNKQRMEEKLKGLVAVADESAWSIDDPELAALLQSVVEAGGKVNVFKDQASLDAAGDNEPAVAEEKPAEEKTLEHGPEVDEPAPKPEKVAKAPKTPKESKLKKEKVAKAPKEKDQFGLRIGSKVSEFCSHLSEEGKTMKELVESTPGGVTSYNLLNRLCAEGKVVKVDGKYKLA